MTLLAAVGFTAPLPGAAAPGGTAGLPPAHLHNHQLLPVLGLRSTEKTKWNQWAGALVRTRLLWHLKKVQAVWRPAACQPPRAIGIPAPRPPPPPPPPSPAHQCVHKLLHRGDVLDVLGRRPQVPGQGVGARRGRAGGGCRVRHHPPAPAAAARQAAPALSAHAGQQGPCSSGLGRRRAERVRGHPPALGTRVAAWVQSGGA